MATAVRAGLGCWAGGCWCWTEETIISRAVHCSCWLLLLPPAARRHGEILPAEVNISWQSCAKEHSIIHCFPSIVRNNLKHRILGILPCVAIMTRQTKSVCMECVITHVRWPHKNWSPPPHYSFNTATSRLGTDWWWRIVPHILSPCLHTSQSPHHLLMDEVELQSSLAELQLRALGYCIQETSIFLAL